ncbi:adenine deaminase [Clostridium sp.]|uniref:adenine deaminase n=1 Tax=Clostridium sp. TaxID=1506 RepID=UPI00290A1137|nr:adenine deaminase [Clostridium sp.]MDU5105853.1 adenine deaminase [Clostridium sp.]
MKILPKDKKGLIEAAIGKRPCDLVIRNANIVNVFTGEIYNGNIGIYDGFITHISADIDNSIKEDIEAKDYYDAKGKYVIPGLIDSHIHIESTLMTPRGFAREVIPYGTTTVVTDPHEIANVHGVRGIKYMHDSSEDLPMRQYVLAPSCVPAVLGLENAGAEFFVEEIEEMLNLDRVIGLGEVMDFIGVIENSDRMVSILEEAEKRGSFIQGHAPFLNGRMLSAYLCGGATTCHESRTSQEARDKIRNGMYVDARESSISKNVTDIVKGVKNFAYLDNLTLCTDDREADEILKNGHMNDVVRRAIKAGLNPIDAVRSATINSAREIGITNLGAIAPGYVADLVVLDDLEDMLVKTVIFQGEIVAEDGVLLKAIEDKKYDIELENSVHVDKLSLEDFKLKAPIENGQIKVNVIRYNSQASSSTEIIEEVVEVENGYVTLKDNDDLRFVIVINRHGKLNTKSIGLVRGFGINKGALGSTISHDSHNLTIVYKDINEAFKVAKDLISMGGGISCAIDGEIKEHIQLEVAGLMTTKSASEIAVVAEKMKEILRGIGLTEIKNPLLRIVTLALPVIPEGKMSDLGLINVNKKEIVSIFNN